LVQKYTSFSTLDVVSGSKLPVIVQWFFFYIPVHLQISKNLTYHLKVYNNYLSLSFDNRSFHHNIKLKISNLNWWKYIFICMLCVTHVITGHRDGQNTLLLAFQIQNTKYIAIGYWKYKLCILKILQNIKYLLI